MSFKMDAHAYGTVTLFLLVRIFFLGEIFFRDQLSRGFDTFQATFKWNVLLSVRMKDIIRMSKLCLAKHSEPYHSFMRLGQAGESVEFD
jgi:hypothetical protein